MPQKIEDIDPAKPIDPIAPAPRSLIVIVGAYDAGLNDPVRSILNRVVVPVAVDSGALIVDDAGVSGCAPLIAIAAAEQDAVPPVIGIIPNERDPNAIDRNHSRVLRLPAGAVLAKHWFKAASDLAPEAADAGRVAVVLFGGGAAEKQSVLWCARRGWPVLVIGQTKGLADDILSAAPGPDGTYAASIDPELREILETADLFPSSLNATMDDLRRILTGRVESSEKTFAETLQEAWLRYDAIDHTARLEQTRFRGIQIALIWLAVLAAFFGILGSFPFPAGPFASGLQILIIVTPIVLSIVAAYNNHFRDGDKWVLLRGAAEAIKREIFRFWAQSGIYSDAQCTQTSRESKLVAKLGDITSALEQSGVNKTSLADKPARPDAPPRRLTPLAPEEYVAARIREQVNDYFKGKIRWLSKRLIGMQLAILVAGGAGTFLAAMKLNVWVALATAVVTALTTRLQSDQTEMTLVHYNQTLATLQNIDAWWKALSSWEKTRPRNIDLLVDQTEKALEAETAGWVQQMQSALDKLTEKESGQTGASGTS
ncbi:MAG TPA: DUF4231 domain-containing protein [Bryobacteraceae bacterium]|nr:DUF4231 domain-containing protein [Bryobacteraceae bacterium]